MHRACIAIWVIAGRHITFGFLFAHILPGWLRCEEITLPVIDIFARVVGRDICRGEMPGGDV